MKKCVLVSPYLDDIHDADTGTVELSESDALTEIVHGRIAYCQFCTYEWGLVKDTYVFHRTATGLETTSQERTEPFRLGENGEDNG